VAQPIRSWVYFIQSEDPPHLVKVGKTIGNPNRRFATLQTGSPAYLIPILLLDAVPYFEPVLHSIFHEERKHGEWFRPTGKVAEFIKYCRKNNVKKLDRGSIRTLLPLFADEKSKPAIDQVLDFYNAVDEHKAMKRRWREMSLAKPARYMLPSN
jgi:hypothetical protein